MISMSLDIRATLSSKFSVYTISLVNQLDTYNNRAKLSSYTDFCLIFD